MPNQHCVLLYETEVILMIYCT